MHLHTRPGEPSANAVNFRTTAEVVKPRPLAAPRYAQTLYEGVIIPFEQCSMFLGYLYEKTSKA